MRSARPFWSRLGFSSVAVAPDDQVVLRQRRLAVYLGALTVAWTANGLIAAVSARLFLPETFSAPAVLRLGTLHAVGNVTLAAAWLVCLGRKRSPAVLSWIDAAVTIGQATLLALMMPGADIRYRSDLNIALAVTFSLMARAAIVPSTGRRTLVIGASSVVPIMVATLLMRARLEASVAPLPMVALQAALWLALAVLLSTTISRVIYGLAARAREAARLGQYTLLRKVGQGGMGVVYLARHALLRRPTAIKLLNAGAMGGSERERFEREVQATSSLRHPNTVAIYDYGRTPDGIFYYAMEYLNGVDLERLIAHQPQLPQGRVVHILAQVAGALGEAHRAGLIHRDVKPSNILLCDHGDQPDFVKVVDFGLVKMTGAPDVTNAGGGGLVGTPLYMSPEAISAPATVDARSDLYALGAVGYALLTGAPPFPGADTLQVISQQMYGEVKPPSTRRGEPISAELEALVMDCLAKDRDQRPAGAGDFVHRLGGCSTRTWTVEDARAWWTREGPALLRSGGEIDRQVAGTVLVDLAARSPGVVGTPTGRSPRAASPEGRLWRAT
jgi:hypothetical protein